MKKKKLTPVQREAKILLAKSIIKNWNKATEQEKKEVEKYFAGLVRNVEQPAPGSGLPGARTQVADVRPAHLVVAAGILLLGGLRFAVVA